MSVKQKILGACLGFVMIIALLGGLARLQADQMRLLAKDIYDHALIGILYTGHAEEQFLRLAADLDPGATLSSPAKRAALQSVLDQLDVAIERANSNHTRAAGNQVRAMLAGLPDLPSTELADHIARAERAIAALVTNFSADGLEARDVADEVGSHSGELVLAGLSLSVALALALGLLLARNLSVPLTELVRSIGLLTEGNLGHELSPTLSMRRDEIGAVARATAFFRATMQKTIADGEERVRQGERNQALRLDAERSAAAAAAKSDFLATMSHEIRTPMNGVATVADLLAETKLSADQLRMVNIIRQSSLWLIRVINDILDFSKLEAQQLHIERVPFMLDEVIDGCCEVLAHRAQTKGFPLRAEGKDLPGICRIGDPLRVRQILLNLLGNAVKFTAEGSVTLALRAEPNEVSFSIIDTGIGIPADKIDSLFQPYNQIRSDTARSYGGTGLGLTITKNLVDLMGGRLEVTSELGRGSRFTVTLSLPSDLSSLCKPSNRAVASHARWQKPDFDVAAAEGAVVLCAEDNAINREVLARVLDRLGFNHEMAEDGAAALALLDRRRHGVILTDAQMPGLDGWQFAEMVRRQEAEQGLRGLPIMMLTANALSESDARTAAVGIGAVLTKPLDVGRLEATLLGAVPSLGVLRVPCRDGTPDDSGGPQEGAVAGGGMTDGDTAYAEESGAEINLDVLVQLVGDDPEILDSMLGNFHAGVIAQHQEIRAAVASGDSAVVARHAHSIKGAARYAGATGIAQICDVLEQRAKQGTAVEAMADDLTRLEAAMDRLPAEIAAALARHRTIAPGPGLAGAYAVGANG